MIRHVDVVLPAIPLSCIVVVIIYMLKFYVRVNEKYGSMAYATRAQDERININIIFLLTLINRVPFFV